MRIGRTYEQDLQDLGITAEEFDNVISNIYDKTAEEMVTLAVNIRERHKNPSMAAQEDGIKKTNEIVQRAFERVLDMRQTERQEAYDLYYSDQEQKETLKAAGYEPLQKAQIPFYGKITYLSLSGREEDSLVVFYDDKAEYDKEVAYQKDMNTSNYGTVLTHDQFIEEIGKALENCGHYTPIGNKLHGDYSKEVARWREENTISTNVNSVVAELREKVEVVYEWEQKNNVENRTTKADGHTGQIMIVSDRKFNELYSQILQDLQAEELEAKQLVDSINNLEYDEDGYLHFSIEVDGYELEGLYRIYDPQNGPSMEIVSIDYGYLHPSIGKYWDKIEASLQETIRERYEKLDLKLEGRNDIDGRTVSPNRTEINKENRQMETPKNTISFTVAECMEFHSQGEVHENIQSIEEAIDLYRKLPEQTQSMIHGISIVIGDAEYPLLQNGRIAAVEDLPESVRMNSHFHDARARIAQSIYQEWRYDEKGLLKEEYDKMAQKIHDYESKAGIPIEERVTKSWENGDYAGINNEVTQKQFTAAYEKAKDKHMETLRENARKCNEADEKLKKHGMRVWWDGEKTVIHIVPQKATDFAYRVGYQTKDGVNIFDTSLNPNPYTFPQVSNYIDEFGELDQVKEKNKFVQQEQTAQEPERKLTSKYKGYAYMQNSDKPKVIFGNSKEKMIQQLQKWNKTRTKGFTYDTCNIGQYDPVSGKYADFEKYDVNSGKNVTKIYLQMPHGLPKAEFNKTLTYLKENGAQYSPYKKQWYIMPEQQDKFKAFLPEKEEERTTESKAVESQEKQKALPDVEIPKNEEKPEVIESQTAEPEAHSAIHLIDNINNEYVIDLKNGETLRIDSAEMLKEAGLQSIEELTAGDVIKVVDRKVQEHMQLLEEEKYSISISKDTYDNRCSVYMENGERIDLHGDQFGVHFPTMDAEDVSELVKNYMKLEPQAEEIKVGDIITVYTPEYTNSESGFKEISGMKEIFGELKEMTAEQYVVQDETGKSTSINTANMYDERQAVIMQRAIAKEMTPEQLDLIGQVKLSAAQMEQVYTGLSDGLSSHQVAMYANPVYETWQMDICRYGMNHGIPFDSLQDVIKNNSMKPTGWEESRDMVDKLIKAQRNLIVEDLRDNKILPEKRLVKKFEKLNGLTGRMHTVKDVMAALKDGKANGTAAGKLMNDIGKDVRHGMKMAQAATAPQSQAKAPVR